VDRPHACAGGSVCDYQLAVLGADVIKVEHPDEPDQSRGTVLQGAQPGAARHCVSCQASNKRAITLDLKTEHDRGSSRSWWHRRRVRGELSPRRARSARLGYERLSPQSAPHLCLLLGIRDTGPHRERTAYDHVIQATSGIMR